MTPSVFLRVIDGKLVLWNYVSHEQFEIDLQHLTRLLQLSKGEAARDDAIDLALQAAGCTQWADPGSWGWDCLSRMFHVGTQIGLRCDEALPEEDAYRGYVEYCASIVSKIPELKVERDGHVIALPRTDLSRIGEATLQNVLRNRKTCRDFDGSPLHVSEVAMALWATFGTVHGDTRGDLEELGLMPIGYRRTSPSGGSLHPSEAYLVAMNVDGIEPGIYHYRSHKHELSLIHDSFQRSMLGRLLCAQTFASDLSYGIFVTSRFDKMWWKYPHSRAYRVALLDIGCLAQTFQLVCTAREIQSWLTGYFIDHEVNKLLELDTDRGSAMFFLGAGNGYGPVAREALQAVRCLSAKEH
ncbi:SagB family peptide dehydrogenase [Cupriavidus sp. TMH.W2]|uniref:SagB family peptide dehydrogenase n=1 Tax=Cupriavidus sp. TMH.W2 TaxID=3434465 RepID=UPI003D77032C